MPGGVVVAGEKIQAAGPLDQVRHAYRGAREEDWSHCLLLPGFVNAHCHLELSYLRGALPGGSFVEWVLRLLRHAPPAEQLSLVIRQAVEVGMRESVRFGVTTIGDITRQAKESRPVAAQGPARIISFGEVAGLGARREQAVALLEAAAERQTASPRLQPGISPHAPYSVEGPVLQACVAKAAAEQLPLTMHLAELTEETEFLATLQGPLRELWDVGGRAHLLLDERVPRCAEGPMAWAQRWGLLGAPTPVVLAHVNYLNNRELELLAASHAGVVFCPRTRAFFGHRAPHRFRELLAAGVNVCLGTDSLASNPDLSVLREAAHVRKQEPGLPAGELLRMITQRGAAVLGLAPVCGTLRTGYAADLVALELMPNERASMSAALEGVVQRAPEPAAVWINGQKVV